MVRKTNLRIKIRLNFNTINKKGVEKKKVKLSTVYPNNSGVTAGGYNDNDIITNGYTASNGTTVVNMANPIGYDSMGNVNAIYSGIIVETSTRRFVNDTERFYIDKLINYGMFKDSYDKDNDGVIDKAKNAENATYSTKSATSEESNNSNHSIESDHSLTSDTANIALIAKTLESTEDATTVSLSQISTWNNKQNKLEYTPENILMKNMPNGYAGLNEEGKIDSAYLYNPRWETIINKPLSSTDEIDDSVIKKHTHSNKSSLDKISENPEGLPIWNLGEWPYPGNMKTSIYDADNDGIVDKSKTAEYIIWKNVTGKPESEVSDIDDAVNKKHYHNNLESLSLISKDENDKPLWKNSTWPYDMSQSMYDKDKDGVIDESSFARNVNWSGINNKPESSVNEIDKTVSNSHTHNNKSILDIINTDIEETRLTFKGKELAFKEDLNVTTDENGNSVTSRFSIEIDNETKSIQLVNDKAFPESNMYYGTDKNQNRGFFKLPDSKFTGVNSIKIDSIGRASLENDNPIPDPNMYYGTNSEGIRGYYQLPEFTTEQIMPSQIDANIITQDEYHRFVSNDQLKNINKIDYILDIIEKESEDPTSKIIDGNVIGNGTRQCMISIPKNFLVLDGSDLIIRSSIDDPSLLSFSVNKNKEIVIQLTSNITVPNVPSIINNGTAYIFLFLEKDSNEIKAGKTSYKPIYATSMPTVTDTGRYWFNINNYTMYKSNGYTYLPAEEPTLFIGEVSAVYSKVSLVTYSCNGIYDSGWFNVNYSTTYNKNHNIGSDLVSVTAYRGLDGVNLGEFSFVVHGAATISDNTPYGDRISKVTDTSIQTTRYNKMPYSDTVYGSSNQHRVIVKRLW